MSYSITIRDKKIYYKNRPDFFRIAQSGLWEKETFDALDRFIKEGQVFVDVGAWESIFSIYAAKLGAIVFGIEPDDVAFFESVENISENEESEDIFLFRLALSNENGKAKLNTNGQFGNSESSLVTRDIQTGQKEVDTQTLSAFLFEHRIKGICLIKIDCEGSECIFIDEGFRDALIEHDLPPIHIAFHPAWFPSPQENIQQFIDVLFPVYDFESVATKKKYTAREFEQAMESKGDHTFLLTAKPIDGVHRY